jgi:integrase
MGVRKNERGKWIVQVHDKETNRNRHIGSFDLKRDADDAFNEARRKPLGRNVTVEDFASRWTIDYPRSASTNLHNGERVKRFAAAYGNRQMSRVDRRTARSWVLEHPSELSSLRAMFSDALRDDLIDSNPFYNLGLKQRKSRRDLKPDWFTENDLQELCAAALLVHEPVTAQLAKSMILTSAYTGIRPGELFALEVSDVRDGELVISKAVKKGIAENGKSKWITGPTKNGKTRVVVLPEIAQLAIEERPQLHDKLVFATPRGRLFTQPSWHWIWSPIRNAVNKPNMHYYELRHWMATHLLEQGLSPSDVAVQLGHTDGGVLVQTIYGHPSENAARDRIKRALDDQDAA